LSFFFTHSDGPADKNGEPKIVTPTAKYTAKIEAAATDKVTATGTELQDIGNDSGASIMAKRPNINRQTGRQPMVYLRPRKPRFRFRSSLVLVPLALLLAAWVLNRIDPAISWDNILFMLGVRNRQRASMLIVLALTLLAILLIKRILGKNRR
jgi:hypothetical protein